MVNEQLKRIGQVFTIYRDADGFPNHKLLMKFNHDAIHIGYRMYKSWVEDEEIKRFQQIQKDLKLKAEIAVLDKEIDELGNLI